ncbi:MAG: 3-isopropylmalate dehydratase, partial [Verrucomicrobia bacterium]|nr:3-isopropylmalate dehydratase [Verrucomicrobiota bacterium]
RERLIDGVKTGNIATVDFDNDTIEFNGEVHQMKPMGDVRPVIEAGGLFNYARQSGMIPKA